MAQIGLLRICTDSHCVDPALTDVGTELIALSFDLYVMLHVASVLAWPQFTDL